MLKKIMDKVNANWDDIKLYAKAGIEGFFIGSGITYWFYVACFGLYGLVTKQKIEINWIKK